MQYYIKKEKPKALALDNSKKGLKIIALAEILYLFFLKEDI